MAIDPFTQAGSGLGPGYSADDYDYAFYSQRSGLTQGSVSDHKLAYFTRLTGQAADKDSLAKTPQAAAVKAKRTNVTWDPGCTTLLRTSSWAGGGTGANTQQSAPGFPSGKSWRLTWDTNSTDFWGGLGHAGSFAVTPGVAYSASLYYRQSRANYVYAEMKWLDSSYNTLRVDGGVHVQVPVRTIQRLSTANIVAPPGAAMMQLWAVSDAGTNWVIGDYMEVSSLLVEQSSTVGSYFDATSPGCSWTGSPTASPSSGYPGVSAGTNAFPAAQATVATTTFVNSANAVTSDSGWAADGSTSVRVTTAGSQADMRLGFGGGNGTSGAVPCLPGQAWSSEVTINPGSLSGHSFISYIEFFQPDGTYIASIDGGSGQVVTGVTRVTSLNAVAPGNAGWVHVLILATTVGAGDYFLADCVGLYQSANVPPVWTPGR